MLNFRRKFQVLIPRVYEANITGIIYTNWARNHTKLPNLERLNVCSTANNNITDLGVLRQLRWEHWFVRIDECQITLW